MAVPANSGYMFTKNLHNDIYPSTDPKKSDLSQPSKVVLITGAGRGIGRSIALRYAETGVATLILCARTISQLESVSSEIKRIYPSTNVRLIATDVTDSTSVTALVKSVTKDQGRLDILINNAGTSPPWLPLSDSDPLAYWSAFEVNVKGTFLMTQGFLPLLLKTAEKEGKVDVVNMSTIGQNIMVPGSSAYSTSKLAVARLSEFVGLEYGGRGVNCFVVHPGGVETELSRGIALPEYLTDTPELAAGLMVWLTKEERSWLSGRYLSATWDVDDLVAMKDEIVEGDKLKVRMVV